MKRLFILLLLIILGLSLVGTSVASAAEEPPQFSFQIPAQQWHFDNPRGVAVDSSGNVYVADIGNDHIQKLDSDGAFLATLGSHGTGDGEFNNPFGVAVDSSGNVYVADTGSDRIQKFESDGTFVATWGSYGSGNGQFNIPAGLAVDSSGNVYVADSNNNRIQKFESDGTFVTTWGSSGSGNGQFYHPSGVAVDFSGNVYVADSNNNRIQKFTPVTGDTDGDGYTDEEEIENGSNPNDPVDIPETLASDELVEMVLQCNLKAGIENSLETKLQNAKNALTAANSGQREDAVNKLQAFINACEAQRDKALTPEQANGLIAKANTIIASLQLQ